MGLTGQTSPSGGAGREGERESCHLLAETKGAPLAVAMLSGSPPDTPRVSRVPRCATENALGSQRPGHVMPTASHASPRTPLDSSH